MSLDDEEIGVRIGKAATIFGVLTKPEWDSKFLGVT
jgi:hypothetical protein